VSYRSVFAADHPGARIRVNGSEVVRSDQLFTPGASIQLSIDSVQADESGRSTFEFLAWTDGGARTHTITAREQPDTIVAQVAAAHRLRTSVQGASPAAVSSGVAGDIINGVYLAEGSQASLHAGSQPAAVFTGWTGDTTATTDTLTLLMQHPFDVTANFVAVQDVVLGNAADALFGTGALLPEETAYLDAVGNRDGVYDLGDFLAAADRSRAAAASPAIAGRPAGSR
jgi:hypothetical protein